MRMLTALILSLGMVLACGCKSSTVTDENKAKLTIVKPMDVTIHRGDTAKVRIMIHREKLDEPVTISFDKLPKGVEVIDGDQKIAGMEGTYTLKAGDNADLVSGNAVTVTAKAGDLSVSEVFMMKVEEKK